MHDVIINIFGHTPCPKPKPGPRLFVFREGLDEPIPKGNMQVSLSKPIKPGFRRPFSLTPDEPVDQLAEGGFAKTEVRIGNSTITINPSSTADVIQGWVNGDGDLGDKSVAILVDGHVGEGEVTLELVVNFSVAHPDATDLAFVEGSADEPIPTV